MKQHRHLGLPLPSPVDVICHSYPWWVYDAVIDARTVLVGRRNTATYNWPIASVAEEIARRWCDAGKHGLTDDAQDRAWLAAVITEILALDPVTRAFLRSLDLPGPLCASCGRRPGGVR
jgi:hypothetical protein